MLVSTLRYLDLANAPQVTATSIFNGGSYLLSNQSWPLQVIEFTDELTGSLYQSSKTAKSSVGWNVHVSSRRSWYIRDLSHAPDHWADDGSGPWKLGARHWGTRKIPMTTGEVVSLHRHYMFKK